MLFQEAVQHMWTTRQVFMLFQTIFSLVFMSNASFVSCSVKFYQYKHCRFLHQTSSEGDTESFNKRNEK